MDSLDDDTQDASSRLQAWDSALAPLARLEGPGLGAPAAWFLGPRAENEDLLRELISDTITQHCAFRKGYQPDDPEIITASVKKTKDYSDAVDALRKSTTELNALLKRSAPVFSMRSHGHMLWDQVLPATVGYFAGMLYNQNNVAAEASPLTTSLEIRVANDLCSMLGYATPKGLAEALPQDTIVPWGHITCDGSIANIEALWAARNAKFFGVALRAALMEVPSLEKARDIEVSLLSGRQERLVDLSTWTLLNLKIDDLVALPYKVTATGVDKKELNAMMKPYALQHIGIFDFYQRFMPDFSHAPVAMVPATAHYSWPKAGTLLGIGQNNVFKIHVDLRARMHIQDLIDKLRHCLMNRIPVIAVVAVIGSTEESSVDPLNEILEVREQFREMGLDFVIHCDAAWGGYFNSMYRDESEDQGLAFRVAPAPEFPMSDYVESQYRALAQADSITVDPHKSGFVPYPAGALCYRNSALRDFVSLAAPVVFHSQLEPTVGIYGIEGSKPGAAATAVYLAHKVIRPTKKGYGKILGQCVWVSKRMYCRLVTMDERDQGNRLKVVPFQMLPAELAGLGRDAVEKERKTIGEFVNLTNKDLESRLEKNDADRMLFKSCGSDQVILAFTCNFRDLTTQEWNQDPEKLNALNNKIFEICSITADTEDPNSIELILTSSRFDSGVYGQDFVDHYARRLGLEESNIQSIVFLISTTMNPWTTDTTKGDFLKVLEDALRTAAYKAIDELGY